MIKILTLNDFDNDNIFLNIKNKMAFLFKNCISIDTETSGLDAIKNGVLSIGACLFHSNEVFYQENKIRNDAKIDPMSLKINGFTENEINDLSKKSEYQSLLDLIDFAKKNNVNVIVGKNPQFDFKFLIEIWLRNGNSEKEFPLSHRLINVENIVLSQRILNGDPVPLGGMSSEQLRNYLSIEEEAMPHNALNGAKMNRLYIFLFK